MAPRRPPAAPPDVRLANTTAEADRGITKLRRRIADVEALRTGPYSTEAVQVVERAISDTVADVFGRDSSQYRHHSYFKIDTSPRYVQSDFPGVHRHKVDEQALLVQHIPGAVTRLEGLISGLDERRAELAEPDIVPREVFEGRTFNSQILAAAQGLYMSRHYFEAVNAAAKTLVALVSAKAGKPHDQSGQPLDGTPLMQNVFSVRAPILKFNDLTDLSDRAEQEGMMYLYSGAVLAVRNPGAHRVGVSMTPERALQYLELLSLLADRLDESKR